MLFSIKVATDNMYMMHIPWLKKIFIHNIRLHFVDECYFASSWHIRLFSIAMMICHHQGNLKGNTLNQIKPVPDGLKVHYGIVKA